MSAFETIRYERDGFIGRLTLARPEKRNAQNPLMWTELAELGATLVEDASLRCLVVSGEGPSFSSGIDLVEGLTQRLAEWSQRRDEPSALAAGAAAAQTFRWIPKLRCPSIAAVQGHALGAGLQLALACDLRVFAGNATVGLVETRYGLMPDMGATVWLPRIVGTGRALELILLGRVIDAHEAFRIGLANEVVDVEELEARASEFAQRLAAQPPLALEGARRAVTAGYEADTDTAFSAAIAAQARCITSTDFQEALRAFSEGRTPVWNGSAPTT